MTTNDLAAIRARAEKATPGPWETRVAALVDYRRIVTTAGDGQHPIAGMSEPDDAAFIAAARTDVPKLCDEVEVLLDELARAREALELAEDGLEFAGTVLLEEGAIKDEYLLRGYGEKLREYLRDTGREEGE